MAGVASALRRALAALAPDIGAQIRALGRDYAPGDLPAISTEEMRRVMGGGSRRVLDNNIDAAETVRDLAATPGREYAVVATPNRVGRTIPGEAYRVDVPPRDLRSGDSTIHHSHPYIAEADGLQGAFPLSEADIDTLRNPQVRGIFSHEPEGGMGYARAGSRAGNRRASRAIAKAFEAAGEHMDYQNELLPEMRARVRDGVALKINPEQDVSAIAAANALRRLGVLSRYSYEPGTEAQQALLDEAEPFLRKAETGALRAAHGSVYGLPYPFTYGRLAAGAGVATGGALALRDALRDRANP